MPKQAIFVFTAILTLLLSIFAFSFLSKNKPFQTTLPQGQIHEIVLGENGFTPNEITIKPGDSIKFTTELNEPFWPASNLHPTHGIYPEFDPQRPIEATSSWTFQFLKLGIWKYHDHLNPYLRGTIIVE